MTEAVRRKPYSIVLLDEFDKAHPDIHEAFYQVFDKGVMEDGEGRMISFRQCFILMTSNIGAGEIEATLAETPDLKTEALRPMLHDVLARFFPAALLARMNVIPYVPLSTEAITHIATKQISRLQQRLRKEVGVSLVLEGDIPVGSPNASAPIHRAEERSSRCCSRRSCRRSAMKCCSANGRDRNCRISNSWSRTIA